MVVLDIACPFVGDSGLELGGLCGAWPIGDDDARTERESIVRVVLLGVRK
jgi:hypothetical protein